MGSFFRWWKWWLLLVVSAFLLSGVAFCVDEDYFDSTYDVIESDAPVTVTAETDDKSIIVNVELVPPSVNVTSAAPVVNVDNPAPVVTVESPSVEIPTTIQIPSVDSALNDDAPESALAVSSFRSLNLESDPDGEDLDYNSLGAVLERLLGPYTPKTQTVTERFEDGTVITYDEYVQGLPGVDWSWIASLCVFLLMLYCLFRVLGSVISRV